MKLNKLINVINKETKIELNCDKDLVLDKKTLYSGTAEHFDNLTLSDSKVEQIFVKDGKLVMELTLNYESLAKYLYEENVKLKDERRKAD